MGSNTKPKLLHIISSFEQGGAQSMLVNFINEFTNEYEQIVVYFHDGPTRQKIEVTGIPCKRVSCFGMYLNPWWWIQLLRIFQQQKPACIISNLWAANFASRLIAYHLRIPCICILHSTQPNGIIRQYADRYLPVIPSTYIAVSPSVKESMIASGCCRKAPIEIISNGISIEIVQKQAHHEYAHAQASRAKLPSHTFLIGAVGRLVPQKQYPILINAMHSVIKKHSNAHLCILGSGPEEQSLRTLIKELNLQDYISIISGQSAIGYYQFFTCFVQPSKYEGLSIALLEALSFSVPVIVSSSSKKNGIPTHDVITQQQDGFILANANAHELATRIACVLEDTTVQKTIGIRGNETVKNNHALSKNLAAYRQIISTIIQKNVIPTTIKA